MNQAPTMRCWIGVLLPLTLMLIPFPEPIKHYMPIWIVLYVLYVQFYMPQCLSVLRLFVLGLILDVLLYTTLGEHAFALIITVWLASRKKQQFIFFSMGQQMILVFLYSLLYQVIILMLNALQGYGYSWIEVSVRSFANLIFWPGVRLLAKDMLSKQVERFPGIL